MTPKNRPTQFHSESVPQEVSWAEFCALWESAQEADARKLLQEYAEEMIRQMAQGRKLVRSPFTRLSTRHSCPDYFDTGMPTNTKNHSVEED